MKKRQFAPRTTLLLTAVALMATPMTANAQRRNRADGPKVGILATTVISTLETSRKAEIRFNGGSLTVVISPNAKFYSGGVESTMDNFYRNSAGKNYYVNINDLNPDVTVDRIWDGVSFAAYKKASLSTSGTVAQHARNVFRVGDMVYVMTDKTKYYYDDQPATKSRLDVGMWAAVSGQTGTTYPEARIVKLWKNKPSILGNKIDGENKVVDEGAKEKLKGGVGKVDSPGLGKSKGNIVKKGNAKSGKPGARGKAKAGGGR